MAEATAALAKATAVLAKAKAELADLLADPPVPDSESSPWRMPSRWRASASLPDRSTWPP